jgi:hypothetical protein
MRRCEDEKMFLQTPTIGRTLRSDALGNKHQKHKNKQNRQKHKKANNPNQNKNKNQHGRWSADQFIGLQTRLGVRI